jgi:hypothetical protein
MDLLVVTPSLPLDCFQSKSLVQLPVLSPNPVSYSFPSVSVMITCGYDSDAHFLFRHLSIPTPFSPSLYRLIFIPCTSTQPLRLCPSPLRLRPRFLKAELSCIPYPCS